MKRIIWLLLMIALMWQSVYSQVPTKDEIGSWIGPKSSYEREEVISLIEGLLTLALEEIDRTALESSQEVREEDENYYKKLNQSLEKDLIKSQKTQQNWERGCLILGGALLTGIIWEVVDAVGQN